MFLGALDLFLVSLGMVYFLVVMGAGLMVVRAARAGAHRRTDVACRRVPDRAGPSRMSGSVLFRSAAGVSRPVLRLCRRVRTKVVTPDGPVVRAPVVFDAADCAVYFLVPCLNEAAVIEDTLRGLLADPRAKVVVVDDASSDCTGALAVDVDPARVRVVRRELPDARQGKGPALNAGYAEVLRDSASRGIAPSGVIICVMDADGRMSARALDAVLPLFGDDRVGGVQLPVRIRNKDSLLTQMQDVEFWASSAVAQLGRTKFGTVSLGGNGQFTRLSALLPLGRDPWRPSLTEDLDLAVALIAAGWRLTSTADAFVSQQAITGFKALIRQRTRWLQGHMLCCRRIPDLWRSRGLSHLGLLEITMYLLTPWVLLLPWSIVFHYSLFMLAETALFGTSGALGTDTTQHVMTLCLWYLLSFMPCWLSGYLYYRQNRRVGLLRSLALGHLLLASNYVSYIACWRALYHIVLGRATWDKTARQAEGAARPVTAATMPLIAHLVPAQAPAPLDDRDEQRILVGVAVSRPDGGASTARRREAARPASHRGSRVRQVQLTGGRSTGAGGHRAPARRS